MKFALVIAGLTAAFAATSIHAGDKHDSREGTSACPREFAADFGERWIMTRKQAKRHVAGNLPGKVISVCADDGSADPHFHVDLRLPHGPIARLEVDATNGDFGWRQPAVLQD
jgi:hypothetical protein